MCCNVDTFLLFSIGLMSDPARPKRIVNTSISTNMERQHIQRDPGRAQSSRAAESWYKSYRVARRPLAVETEPIGSGYVLAARLDFTSIQAQAARDGDVL